MALGRGLHNFGKSASFIFLGPVFTVALILAIVGIVSWTVVLVLAAIGGALIIVQVTGGAIEGRTRIRVSRETNLTADEYLVAAAERGDLTRE